MQYKNLAELRNAKRLTQADVAKELGITQQGYCLIERGGRGVSAKKAVVLSKLFGVSVEDIILLSLQHYKNLCKANGTENN